MDQLEPTPIRGTDVALDASGAARSPFFSPDGGWIGFWQDGQLKKVSVTGGAALDAVCCREPTWCQLDERQHDSLRAERSGRREGGAGICAYRAKAESPSTRETRGSQIAERPQLLPGGRAILFTLVASRGEWDTAQIVVQSLDSGRRDVVVERGTDAQYVPTGHLVYALDGTLLAVPLDVPSSR